ncbi:NAD(P)/FAD-dependent oxidoreductase [Candidatus Hepatincolaceae symbiont of Richtersius coronifer]
MNKKATDLLIIGAGPVGLFASYQAGFLGMKTIIVDALDEIGGQLNALYPGKYIYDVAGLPKILAKDLIANLIEQSGQYNKNYLLSSQVTELYTNEDKSFDVKTSKNDIINCKAIIIAAGAGAFGPNRPLIEGINDYEGKSVHYLVKNPQDFSGKNVVIAGGGDSAVDWAITLADIAKKIYIIHRRNNFKAAASSMATLNELAKTDKLELVIPYNLDGITGQKGILNTVRVKSLENEVKDLPADHLLAFFGLSRSLGALDQWGFKIDQLHSTIEVKESSFETQIPGIFAVGDVAKYNHKLKLITLGFGEAASAVHCTWKYVFKDKVFHFVHSTAK